jgi:tetratricopeptide (TPR) repeat protein
MQGGDCQLKHVDETEATVMNRRLTCLISFFLCCIAHTALAAGVATARKLSGDVTSRAGGQTAYGALSAGKELAEGSWVRTGKNGWVELVLADGSTITLANNGELELTRMKIGKDRREGVLNLAQGKLRASVVKLAGKQADIKVKSGTAVAGVKGTEFLMMTAGPANVFFGNDGSVTVSGSGTEEKLLRAGTMTQTTRGYEPEEPYIVEPGSPLSDAQATFNAITGQNPPAEWLAGDALPAIIARWNVNYAHYLTDRGSYQEALRVLQIAIDLTQIAEIRADALLERGTIQGRFLNNPRLALVEFLLVLEEYPQAPQAQIALFSAGQALYELKLYDQAASRLRQYLATYPSGRYRGTVEILLNAIEADRKNGTGK